MKYAFSILVLGAFALKGEDFSATSSSFKDGAPIPAKFATEKVTGGKNLSPQLFWKGAPAGTKSFVIVCVDTHPVARRWVHWMVINVPADHNSIAEGASGTGMPKGAAELVNSFGEDGWGGPQPPPGTGRHEYVFTIYALKTEKTEASGQISEEKLANMIKGNILAKASFRGYFSR